MRESRVMHLEFCLATLGFNKALEAMDFVIKEMCAEKGFTRHDGSHYYYHLIDATQDLFNHGIKNEDILTACLLHDVVEDIESVTLEMIEGEFGFDVATMVNLVTKKKHVDYKQSINMHIYLDRISQNVGASLIKTADRKHNFSTLKDATREKKIRQASETEKLFVPFFKYCRKMYPRYASYFYSAKTAIEPHLWEIQEHYSEVERLEKELEAKNLIAVSTKYRVEFGTIGGRHGAYLGNTIQELHDAIDSDKRLCEDDGFKNILKYGYFGEFNSSPYITKDYVVDNCMHFMWTVK